MKHYLINLEKRADRLQASAEQLKNIGIIPERFNAYTGDNPKLAFNKSQYHCIKKGIAENADFFGVFEDDVMFTQHAAPTIQGALNELAGRDWLLLHLGCNILGMHGMEWKMPTREGVNIARIYNGWQTHAILWNSKRAAEIIDTFAFHDDKYEREGLMIFDEWLRVNMYPHYPCYVMRPMVAWQRPDYSDIWNNPGDYTYCFHEGNKYLTKL